MKYLYLIIKSLSDSNYLLFSKFFIDSHARVTCLQVSFKIIMLLGLMSHTPSLLSSGVHKAGESLPPRDASCRRPTCLHMQLMYVLSFNLHEYTVCFPHYWHLWSHVSSLFKCIKKMQFLQFFCSFSNLMKLLPTLFLLQVIGEKMNSCPFEHYPIQWFNLFS